jgi:hypothetical protein
MTSFVQKSCLLSVSIASLVLLATATVDGLAQTSTDESKGLDRKYEQLLEEYPSIRAKIERGDTTKADVIEWMKNQAAEKKWDLEEKLNWKKKLDWKGSEEKGHLFPDTAFEYAKLVETELGVPPKVDLNQAVESPIYVDGEKTLGPNLKQCDNPTLLGKVTASGSMIQRYEGQTADGKPLPDVVWVAFARNSPGFPGLGSVQMIGYNQKSGATAFFESSDALRPWVKIDPKTTRMTGVMPWIDEPQEFNRAYRVPGTTQCVQCHQNEPFITNSFINAAKIPGTNETVIPILDQKAPYYVIGGENWDMRTIHIEDNACFDCHRVGMSTMELFMSNGWDPNQHMPPHDPGSLKDDLRELLDAWRKGPENVPGAEWIIPPARGEERRIVGADYPFKAEFNERNSKEKVKGLKRDKK